MSETAQLTTTIAGMLRLQLASTLALLSDAPEPLRSQLAALSRELIVAESAGFSDSVSETYIQAAATARDAGKTALSQGYNAASATLNLAAGRLERAGWFVGAHAA